MAGLGILLYGAMQAICGIGRTVENEQSKKNSTYVNEKGQTISYGRTGQQYINGEKTYRYTETDKYGHNHTLTIGVNSGKVYDDDYDRRRKTQRTYTKQSYDYAIEHGKLAYDNYNDPRFDNSVLTEISTGKIITCLYEGTNIETGKKEYRKWYLTDEVYREWGKSSYNKTENGDFGIIISKEEYRGLGGEIARNAAHLPNDGKVLNKLWGYTCF